MSIASLTDSTEAHASATREADSDACTAASIAAMPLERLEREIGELAAHIHAATCRWLELVAELDRREGWAEWGCRSCADWLSLRCGIAPGAAREQVRVARSLTVLELTRAAFAAGKLSFSKARAISRVATAENEAELVELALQASAAQLERIVRGYRSAASADASHTAAVDRDRHLTSAPPAATPTSRSRGCSPATSCSAAERPPHHRPISRYM